MKRVGVAFNRFQTLKTVDSVLLNMIESNMGADGSLCRKTYKDAVRG